MTELLFSSLATAPLDNPALGRVALCVGLVIGGGWLAMLSLPVPLWLLAG